MAVPTVPNESPSNPAVLAAYRLAADIANSSRSYHVALAEALEFAVGRCSAGARIIDVCRSVDEHILGLCSSLKDASPKGTSALLWKGVAFPTCISTNNLLCHFSPVEGDAEAEIALQPNDLAKIELGAQVDGYPVIVCHSIVVGGKQSDKLVDSAHAILQAHLETIKSGTDTLSVVPALQHAVAQQGVKFFEGKHSRPLVGVMSHTIARNNLAGDASIVVQPSDEQKPAMKREPLNDYTVIVLDIAISDGEGKFKQAGYKTNVYHRTAHQYGLKLKSSRAVLTEATKAFGSMAFHWRALKDVRKSRIGLAECVKNGLLAPYDVFGDRDDSAKTARLAVTVILLPNGQTEQLSRLPPQ